jgi:hypothetical protein
MRILATGATVTVVLLAVPTEGRCHSDNSECGSGVVARHNDPRAAREGAIVSI